MELRGYLETDIKPQFESMNSETTQLLDDLEKINDESGVVVLKDFWPEIKDMLNEMTKTSAGFCIMFTERELPPFEQSKLYIAKMLTEATALHLKATRFPPRFGLALRREVLSQYQDASQSLYGLILAGCQPNRYDTETLKKEVHQINGQLWSSFKNLSGVPQTNVRVALNLIQQDNLQIDDAMHEVQEAIEKGFTHDFSSLMKSLNEEEENDIQTTKYWSGREQEVVLAAIGVLKGIKFLSLKLVTALTHEATRPTQLEETERNLRLWKDLDELLSQVKVFPEMVDDVSVALYNADGFQETVEMVDEMMPGIARCCNAIRALGAGEESTGKGVDFAEMAINHNRTKFMEAKEKL